MMPSCAAALDEERCLEYALAGGDDYELVFTAPAAQRVAVEAAAARAATRVTRIGCIEAAAGLRLVDARGEPLQRRFGSFDHFA
jgi:thiamine-monophosphate kinase